MDPAASILIFLAGLALVLFFAEKMVEGVIGASRGWGMSAFLIGVVFIGFDPENLFLGAVASLDGSPGIAMGTIAGSAMVAVALAFGITALLVPMKFKRPPTGILALPVLSTVLIWGLAADGRLSRTDGTILLIGYFLSVYSLVRMGKRGLDIQPAGEVADLVQKEGMGPWKSIALLVLSLAGIIAGSYLMVMGSKGIISAMGISDTVFGMTLLALVVSVEEVARELPAAWKGRPDITFGNVVGSILAFFLFNAGVISLFHPVPVGDIVLQFYLPICLITTLFISLFMVNGNVSRWAGVILVVLYIIFFAGGFMP